MRKLLAFLAVVAITACDSRVGSSFVAPQTPSIIGSFKLRTVNGAPLPFVLSQTAQSTELLVADTLTFTTGIVVLRASGVTTTTPPGGPVPESLHESGTYTLSNGVLTLALQRNSGIDVFTGTQNGGNLTVVDGSFTYAYTK